MEKEKILEFLEKNNINYLKLGNVSFIKSENTLCLTFLYSEENHNKIKEEKSNLEKLIKQYVDIKEITYNIKFNKAFLDEERLKNCITDFLKEEHHLAFCSIKEINSKKIENSFDIAMKVSLSGDECEKIEREILNFLNSKYFYSFNIKLERIQETLNILEEHKNEILSDLTEPLLIKKIKVNKIENVIGEVSDNTCYPFEYYKNPEENIFLCGTIENIEEIEFTKKDGETKGIRYALKIKNLESTFNASLFPSKKNLEICKTIENGIQVIMNGSLDIFNNSLNFKVKSLAKCEIQEYEKPKKEFNKENKVYKVVFPKKYQEVTQINLFDIPKNIEYLNNNEFVVFDLETTGLDFATHKVTEIGAVKIKNGKIIETFSSFVNPQKEISREITRLTGITNEMVKDAPLIEDVIPDFYKFCKNCILVGQNVQFDFGFIDYFSRKCNYLFDHQREDTIVIAKKNIFLRNYKLKTIAEALNVPLINAHRAINDAICTAKVFIKLIEKFY